jgi:hypothetical protein
MTVIFWIKSENGKLEHKDSYSFQEEEFTKLKSDFDKYSQGSDPIKGGSYKCKFQHVNMTLFLKFDEIAFIAAYPEQ